MMTHPARREDGFGMVVIALLFTAFAVIAAMMLDRDAVKTEIARQQQVEAQLTRLNVALMQYARFNGDRFPCPASYELAPNHTTFGAAIATNCRGTGAAPAGTALASSSGSKLLMGMVPVRELVPYGINYGDAFDPWGSRIIFAVHRDLTTGASGAEISAATDAQRAVVTDYVSGDTITWDGVGKNPDAILVSYGRDRMNGRLRSQGALGSPAVGCAAATQRRYLNCDGDRSFIRGPLYTAASAPVAQYFDDTISAIRYFQ